MLRTEREFLHQEANSVGLNSLFSETHLFPWMRIHPPGFPKPVFFNGANCRETVLTNEQPVNGLIFFGHA